jgi:hypothetical protein
MKEAEEIELIHKEIQSINKKLDKVLLTLLGDDEMSIEGLVSKVSQHERYIQKQKLLMAKISGISTVLGIAGGLLVQLLLKLMS